MTLRFKRARVAVVAVFLCSLLTQCGCTQPSTQQIRQPGQTSSARSYNLTTDEGRGGHTLKRHVNKSDEDLRSRLAMERNITAASTYTDKATAEAVVGNVTGENHSRIEQWLQRRGGHPNLVLDYEGQPPIGRTMRRSQAKSLPCSHAIVVLKWLSGNDFFVLTSYPECR